MLNVLLARASGRPLEMKDTGFSVPAAKLDRLATCYQTDATTSGLAVFDEARSGLWSRPPVFPHELVSTVDDYLAFGQMMLNQGKHGRERVLSRLSVEAMTTDQLTPEQKAGGSVWPRSPGATTSPRCPAGSDGTAATARPGHRIPRRAWSRSS